MERIVDVLTNPPEELKKAAAWDPDAKKVKEFLSRHPGEIPEMSVEVKEGHPVIVYRIGEDKCEISPTKNSPLVKSFAQMLDLDVSHIE